MNEADGSVAGTDPTANANANTNASSRSARSQGFDFDKPAPQKWHYPSSSSVRAGGSDRPTINPIYAEQNPEDPDVASLTAGTAAEAGTATGTTTHSGTNAALSGTETGQGDQTTSGQSVTITARSENAI
ncbi:hypothetical protein IAT40_007218 [Kwoniella sp. CBS 6097]